MKFLVCFLLSAVALAAAPFKIKYVDLMGLQAGLQALDGRTDLDAQKNRVVLSYDFAGSTRVKIAKDMAAIKAALAPIQEAGQAILKANGVVDSSKSTPEQTAKVNDQFADATKNPIAVELETISTEELKLDTNPIPGSVLIALDPIRK